MTKSPARQRNLPFLHRNWLTAVNFLQSATVGSKPDDAHSRSTDGHDDHYLRPAKRRRFASSPDSGIGQDVDSLLLPYGPGEIKRAIRIEVLKITHQDVSHVRSNGVLNGTIPPAIKDVTSVNARCKLTITTPSHTIGESRTLYCDSQMCTIKTFQNPVGSSPMARVYLSQPFHVPEEKIYVERDDDTVFDLADSYTVKVDLESAGDRNWPPLNLVNTISDEDFFMARSASRHWVLGAEIPKIFDRGRRSGLLRLRRGTEEDIRTGFILDIDVRGTTALPERHAWVGREKAPLSSVTIIDQNDEPLPLSNGHVNGQHISDHLANGISSLVEDDIEEVAEGELTPSRSLRIRGNKNYNLKVLSAQAHGKEVRKRARAADSKRAEADSILYHLPREATPFKEVLVDGLACCFCHASHRSLAQLRAHLDSHVKFRCDVNPGKTGGQIHVICTAIDSGPLLRPRIYQLGKPTKAFDLDKYVEGDDSWVKSRLGPHNDDGPVIAPKKAAHTRTVQPRAFQVSKPTPASGRLF